MVNTFKELNDIARGKKIGFAAGAFDLLHAGHVLMLEEAKNQCDILVVALQSDPSLDRDSKNSPIQGMFGRYVSLQGQKSVDYIFPYSTEEDLYNLLQILPINIRILDETYEGKDFTGKDLGIEIYYNKRKHNYSSSNLRKDVSKKEK
jgi:glycerol-3-phosphate cytidylyltransferase